ncbi:MAG: dihydroneopterin aldolase [Actinobacteria bacterium]|nr:dihydroneopterin aldolase [Actinomycetota bacterium]
MAKFEIAIQGLKVWGHHGVLQFEKDLGQFFVIDANLVVEAGIDDELAQSVSYAEIAELIAKDVQQNPVNLIETLAMRLHAAVMEFSPRILSAKITVHKPNAPINLEYEDVLVSYSGENG